MVQKASCGMGQLSGEVGFRYGFPCCASLGSGALLIVVPQKFGACYFNPNLNESLFSIDALKFCDVLASTFKVQAFSNLPGFGNDKVDVQSYKNAHLQTICFRLSTAAGRGDVCACRYFVHLGGILCLNEGDYDGRTALHIACADGFKEVVELFLSVAGLKVDPKDRWGQTPMDEAKSANHHEIVALLEQYSGLRKRSSSGNFGSHNSLQDMVSIIQSKSNSDLVQYEKKQHFGRSSSSNSLGSHRSLNI